VRRCPPSLDGGCPGRGNLEDLGREALTRSFDTKVIGTVEDVTGAVLFAMTNTFLTGVTLKADGGERLT
jgi:hypothetical protein